MGTKSRGAIVPSKIQVNWRMRKDVIQALSDEAKATGFSTIPALVNHILFMRYFGKEKGE